VEGVILRSEAGGQWDPRKVSLDVTLLTEGDPRSCLPFDLSSTHPVPNPLVIFIKSETIRVRGRGESRDTFLSNLLPPSSSLLLAWKTLDSGGGNPIPSQGSREASRLIPIRPESMGGTRAQGLSIESTNTLFGVLALIG